MAAFKGGFFGKFLDINLTTGEVKTRTFDEAMGRRFMGGTGLASYYMYTEIPTGADPLGPENLLIIASGPLCGTQFPGARSSVNFKSPISGAFGNAFIGGTVAQEIKFAGWDMIIFRGKAPKPVYVDIKDDKVEIHDASALWGQDTHNAEENIKEELNDPYARILVIGPAGENMVKTACIISERFRAAGRGGGGAVMGSKNLKGLAVRGTKAVPIADPAKFHPVASDALRMSAVNDRNPGFRKYGTAQSMDQNNFVTGSLITRNFQTTWFPEITRIGAAQASSYFWQRHVGCMGCMISCMKFGVLRDSEKYKGMVAEGPEYESGGMLGPNLGISDFDGMMYLIEYCDAMGIDNIGTPNTVAFTVELLEKGILKPADLDGIDAKWVMSTASSSSLMLWSIKKARLANCLPWVCMTWLTRSAMARRNLRFTPKSKVSPRTTLGATAPWHGHTLWDPGVGRIPTAAAPRSFWTASCSAPCACATL